MKKIHIMILSVFVFIAFYSCRKKLDIDLPETEKHIVINGLISPDSLFKINVTESKGVLDNKPVKELSSAVVKLYKDGVFVEQPAYTDSGYFVSGIKPELNSVYKIKVEYGDLKSAEAETKLMEPVEILSVDTSLRIKINDWGDGYIDTTYKMKLEIKIKDDGNRNNFYFLGITDINPFYENNGDSLVGYNEYSLFYDSNEPFFKKENIDFTLGYVNGKVFNDEIFNGNYYTITVNLDLYKDYYYNLKSDYREYMVIKLFSVSEDIYNFIISYNLNRISEYDPFAQPVQVFTNVKNGFGLFSGYSLSVDSLILNY